MPRFWRIIAVLIISIFVCGAKMKVHSTFDPKASFTGLKTYAWSHDPVEKSGDPRVDDPILNARIKDAIEDRLAANKYEKLESGNPDFLIQYHASLDDRMKISDMNSYYNISPSVGAVGFYTNYNAWSYVGGVTDVKYYAIGSLALDVIEPRSKQPIWRGIAQAEVQKKDSTTKRQKRLEKAVKKILKEFPPKK